MTTTNFDSDPLVTNDGVTSATYSGWTFGASSAVDFANANSSNLPTLLNQSGGRSIISNYGGANVTDFYFKSSDGSDFQLNSFEIDNGPNGASTSLTIAGYRDNALIVSAESVNLITSDGAGNITYTQQDNAGSSYSGLLTFNSAFNNIDEIRFVFGSAVELTVDDIDISAAVVPPTITSATYDASTNSLIVTGTNMVATGDALNDIDVSKLTLTGQGGATYALTSSNVEISSATQFTVALNTTDQINVEGLLNKNGTSSVGATTYNIAAAADWNPAQTGNADTTGNAITVSNVQTPTITSSAYDASTGTLVVTGSNFVQANGATNDITANKLTFTGEGGSTYTLTDSSNVEITSGTVFTVTLSATDKAAINQIINKNGTSSTGATTYNLAAADDWNTVIGNTDISDATGNGITVSNVAAPTITSATFDASTGALVVTGSGFLKVNGATNDIDVSKLTFTGEGGNTYTLTDSSDVEITSGTAFTVTLSGTDKAAINLIVNKNGTASTIGTTYNLAAAEDWAVGADAAVVVADLTGNGMTVSNVAVPTITSATYSANTGALVVTGTNFLNSSSVTLDIVANKFTFTGEGGSTYTLTDFSNVEITSGTAFTITLSATDQAAINQIINKNGTSSTGGTTYNLAAAEDWAAGADAAVTVADTTGNGITVSNVAVPVMTSATYDYSSNVLTVTGTGFLQNSGAVNDIDLSKLTITGESGATYTLTTATDVDITPGGTEFWTTLTGADLINVESLLNKDGTSSISNTTYNLAGAEDWAAGADAAVAVADLTGNGITVSNYAAPAITSATFDASTNVLTVTGTNFVTNSGANNDIAVSLLTLTGEGGNYTLTSSDVEVTSATAFSVTLNATDQLAVHGLLNKNGTASSGATTYNIAAAEDWMAGTAASVTVADLTGNGVTVSNVQTPTITSATYDSDSGILVVTGTHLFNKTGASNDVVISTLTLTGGIADATYTITSSSDVEITSATSFSVTLSGTDKTNVDALLDQTGTTSSGGSTYNLSAADNWLAGADSATDISDTTNAITVSINPRITSATYDASSGALDVTATNLQANGGGADIDASLFTFTGEDGTTYTLTDSADVEITSASAFTIALSATDKAAINQIVNKNGTASTGGTTYNLAAADDWNTQVTSGNTSDTTSNGITASNVTAPAITSAAYDASTGALGVTGNGFLKAGGATNDIDASKFTFTGEGGETYTLIDSADVEIASGTAFTITLSATDKAAINQIVNKNGTASTGATTYNLAAAEDWATGADAAVNVADTTGNGVTVSNVVAPVITSATYNTGTGILVVTGSGFLKTNGAGNDIDASKFTFTGELSGTRTLIDSASVEITSGTTFTITLGAADKAAVNLLLNKTGTVSNDATTYNLAAAEDWAAGADAAVNVADLAGNGITVTVATSSSGGGGNGGSTTTTVDGVEIATTTQSDGTVITTLLPITGTREDDPSSLLNDHADIPLITGTSGNTLLTISLPTGVGVNAQGLPQEMNLTDARSDLIQRIAQQAGIDSADERVVNPVENFLSTLNSETTLSIRAVTPTINSNQAPELPIIITGTENTGNPRQALIIDASNLPPGSILQLMNVAFAFIIGAASIAGGAGENYVVGDDNNQYIVLGADNDVLFGGGGDDTIGSLGGDDQTSGDAGNDIVFGGSGNDRLSGGSGNDRLNGGLGFDTAVLEGELSDYRIEISNDNVTLTQLSNEETDTLTDIELLQFATGSSTVIAYSENEAVAHHLAKTWLKRDLTAVEGNAVQNWEDATPDDILTAFYNLPEAIGFQDKTSDELLAGLNTNPSIIRLDAIRNFTGSDENDLGYLPLGLSINADGGAGHDVLQLPGTRENVHVEFSGDWLELTQLSDGAMLNLKNAEMIAFDNGESVVIAHNATEGILGRLFHSFFDRDATMAEWQLGREALQDQIDPDTILDWFQQRADLDALTDADYVQTVYSRTLDRSATDDELSVQMSRLANGQIERKWLAVEIAQGSEAATHLIGSVMLQEGWI
ncbi:DUF4214 domain-containing protein [Nitrosomonas ureae]|uniref:DUF4214 domain-containing protein n=1 Tax=Nitrosomonas ureae TaxID=44577 RepID=A0A1H2GA88_9PROT|nr:DUF4214 domain-containing protein [Nitrosomonas ureae]SDU16410.1 protein of unknown function [Nitrosomonas ureae]